MPACRHFITEPVAGRLKQKDICPSCVIQRHIAAIKDIQQRLIRRGGVFNSCGFGGSKSSEHKFLTKKWHQEKVGLFNTISVVETLLEEDKLKDEDKTRFKAALEGHEKEKLHLAVVPGQQCETAIVKNETARLMMTWLKRELESLLLEDGMEAPAINELKTATPARKKDSSQTLSPSVCQYRLSKLEPPKPAAILPPLPLMGLVAPKSILKRQLSSATLSSSPTRKRLRISNFAIVRSDDPKTITIKAHSPYTTAEDKRRKRIFKRASRKYEPGQWASPAFYEKSNTSGYKKSWEEIEKIVAEGEKEEDEKNVDRGLKVVSNVWLMTWWLRHVLSRVDLENMTNERASMSEDKVMDTND